MSFDLPFWEIVGKSTLVLALTALSCRLLRGQSAALRHRVWVIGLAATLLVPLVSLVLPRFLVPVLPLHESTLATTPGTQRTHPIESVNISQPGTPRGESAHSAPHQAVGDNGFTPVMVDTFSAERPSETYPASGFALPRIEQLLACAWLLGSALSATRFVLLLGVQRVRLGRLRTIQDAEWAQAVARAAQAIGLQRPIDTLQSESHCVPAVIGLFAPRLVIPANWRSWTQSQRHCVLLHELAHVKRGDVAAQLLGRLALIVYWFNPLVWYAVRQLRTERELASDDCVLGTGQSASDYAEELLRTLRTYRPRRLELGVAMAHSARLDQRVLAILDPQRSRDAAGLRLTCLMAGVAGALVCTLASFTLTSQAAGGPAPEAAATAKKASPVWQENYAVEYPGTLPVSVAFSADGKFLLTGDTAGELMTLILDQEFPTYRWKAKVGGSHAAVAYSADQTKVYATTKDGAVILDATTGKELERIDLADSGAIALGVFPDKQPAKGGVRHQLALGHPRGYFVESWVEGKLADTRGTIKTNTVAQDAELTDEEAVPLAVDPQGRSAIMTGPVDATGESGGVKGKNVLWAYVCGDHDQGSPGNRILVGHKATVVSAAWSKAGRTAVTGDADGRVIIWDAKTMKEVSRLELGGRVAALAISDDGTHTAAYVLGKQGEVYVWDTAKPEEGLKPGHTELSDFAGPRAVASLAFAPGGKRLAGCAIHKKWLTRLGELVDTVRIWELAAEPKAQVAPKHSYVKNVPEERSADFVMLNNESLLMPASKEGAVDLRRIRDGIIQARIVLGKFTLGRVKMSSDRKWVAIEQHALVDPASTGTPSRTFDVGIYSAPILYKSTIPACSQLLDVGSGAGLVAVVRDKQIELWDVATAKKVRAASFKHTQIDAAALSPDSQLLAISDRNELILWRWEEDKHERIDLGRCVSALAFSPNGKWLAEGCVAGFYGGFNSFEVLGLASVVARGRCRRGRPGPSSLRR